MTAGVKPKRMSVDPGKRRFVVDVVQAWNGEQGDVR